MKTCLEYGVIRCLAILAIAIQSACAQQAAPDAASNSPQFASRPFPAEAARYQVRLFELIDPDEKRHDPEFARQLRDLVAPQVRRDANFLARLTSGPTAKGSYFAGDGASYVHYSICQAHQCDTTTLDVLFDPVHKKMIGKLRDRCGQQWLGHPDKSEMSLLDQRQHASHPASASACAGAR